MTEEKEETPGTDDSEIKAFKVKAENKEEEAESKGCGDDKCCALTLDIIHTTCVYIMSIFFLAGSIFLYPRVLANSPVSEPFTLIFVGTLFHLASSSIEVFKTKAKGILALTMSGVALFGGVLWTIGSIFLFRKIVNEVAFGCLWLLGSLCNLVFITTGIVKIFLASGPKPLFHTIALKLSWIANLLFFSGSAHLLAIHGGLKDGNYNACDLTYEVVDLAGLLLSGSILYLIHAIFHTLSLFKGGIKFKVEFSSST